MAVTTAESVMPFRVLTMAINLSGLTAGAMNINTGRSEISKGEEGVSRNCFLYTLMSVLTIGSFLIWLATISLMMHGRCFSPCCRLKEAPPEAAGLTLHTDGS